MNLALCLAMGLSGTQSFAGVAPEASNVLARMIQKEIMADTFGTKLLGMIQAGSQKQIILENLFSIYLRSKPQHQEYMEMPEYSKRMLTDLNQNRPDLRKDIAMLLDLEASELLPEEKMDATNIIELQGPTTDVKIDTTTGSEPNLGLPVGPEQMVLDFLLQKIKPSPYKNLLINDILRIVADPSQRSRMRKIGQLVQAFANYAVASRLARYEDAKIALRMSPIAAYNSKETIVFEVVEIESGRVLESGTLGQLATGMQEYYLDKAKAQEANSPSQNQQ